MGIYTKAGDSGKTSLINDKNIDKFDIRLDLIGTLDELSAHLGVCAVFSEDAETKALIEKVQKRLVKIMAHIADEKNPKYTTDIKTVENLEIKIDYYESLAPKADGFVLPGASLLSAELHVARTVARRAERLMALVFKKYFVCENTLKYMNRVSDLFYVMASYESFVHEIAKGVKKSMGISKKAALRDNAIDLNAAKTLIEKMEARAKEMGLNAAISVVKPDGRAVAVHVMEEAILVSFDASLKKAYTAVALKMPTEELSKISQPGQMFYGVENVQRDKLLAIGGGVLLESNGAIVGGLGVSGGTDTEDIMLSRHGKEVFEHEILRGGY